MIWLVTWFVCLHSSSEAHSMSLRRDRQRTDLYASNENITHRKYNSTNPSAILRPGTPAISHSRCPCETPLSLSVCNISLSSKLSSRDSAILRPSLRPQPYPVREVGDVYDILEGKRPEGGGLWGMATRGAGSGGVAWG